MKKIILIILFLAPLAFSQSAPSKYEAEMLKNPNKGGKDTREVNAVVVFEKDVLKIISRRKPETFKEYKYSDIKYVEHSYSKTPFMTSAARAAVLLMLTRLPVFYGNEEKHWLTILTEDDFSVLKIENDNYRLLRMEFLVRKFDIVDVNENR